MAVFGQNIWLGQLYQQHSQIKNTIEEKDAEHEKEDIIEEEEEK